MTIQPSSAMITSILGMSSSLYLIISTLLSFVVQVLQARAQMQHGVAFARQQGVDGHAALERHLLETQAVELVRDEDLALIRRQFLQRRLQVLEQHGAVIGMFGTR